jgi:hypothetical protein
MRSRRGLGFVLACVAAACSGSDYGEASSPAPAPDAGTRAIDAPDASAPSDAGPGDAPPPTPTCDVAKPFGAPVEVTLGTGDIRGASLSSDELTITFARDGRIQRATRASRMSPFGTSVDLPDVNGTGSWGTPRPAPDGKTMYLARDTAYGPLLVVSAAGANGVFGAPVDVMTPSNQAIFGVHPWVNPTGTIVHFTTGLPDDAGGGYLIVARAPIQSTGRIGAVTISSELAHGDFAPVLTPDELTMYFASGRAGGAGGNDIWRAARPNRSAAWGNFARVTELASSASEEPSWLSDDACRIYITRGSGSSRILFAERSP